ncbi:MAG: staphylococcal enterotoxin [Bacteroidales bacterium]|jgi:hypothetical protein|nr:staphylococcal enterotoxin [Bacteroidales bacterium]
MKNIIIILTIGLFIITGCTGVKTVTKGLEDQSYIELIGNPSNYSGGVDVTIDETTTFKAKVNKAGAKRPKGSVYAISTGKHVVTVKYNNETIFSKQIFVSTQETKQIILP